MNNIKEDLKKRKPIFGLTETIRKMQNAKVSLVYVSKGSHEKDRLVNLGKSLGIEVVLIEESSKDLGILCKKPFSISVISFE